MSEVDPWKIVATLEEARRRQRAIFYLVLLLGLVNIVLSLEILIAINNAGSAIAAIPG